MSFFVSNLKWLMLVSGLLTCTMFLGLVAPQSSLQSNFGETMQGPLSEILVRNWSALIGLMGVMLIYGAVVGPVTYSRGVVTEFFALRDLIVALPNYTANMGEDLGIVGAEIQKELADETAPVLKTVTSTGNRVNLTGSMKGMDAMRVEYAPKGGNFSTVAFLTNTPGGFQITPANPNLPETGHIRAIYIKRNEDFGNYSPDYPVTLS